MKTNFLFLLLIFPVFAWSDQDLEAKIVDYGLWEFNDESPSVDPDVGLVLLEKTNEVPMKIGSIFIFKYEISGRDGDYPIKMIHWKPKLVQGNVERIEEVHESEIYKIEGGKKDGFWGHSLTEEKHLIPGVWGYKLVHGDIELLKFEFVVK